MFTKPSTSYPTKASDIVGGKTFAILHEATFTSPGYDRGDSDYQSDAWTIETFPTEEMWKSKIVELTKSKQVYGRGWVPVVMTRPAINISIDVEIK
jgi:hypothetical protein